MDLDQLVNKIVTVGADGIAKEIPLYIDSNNIYTGNLCISEDTYTPHLDYKQINGLEEYIDNMIEMKISDGHKYNKSNKKYRVIYGESD